MHTKIINVAETPLCVYYYNTRIETRLLTVKVSADGEAISNVLVRDVEEKLSVLL